MVDSIRETAVLSRSCVPKSAKQNFNLKAPSVLIERSWNMKKIPGSPCGSFSLNAEATSEPMRLRVYEDEGSLCTWCVAGIC